MLHLLHLGDLYRTAGVSLGIDGGQVTLVQSHVLSQSTSQGGKRNAVKLLCVSAGEQGWV